MREVFVTELVKEVLGPRNGAYEEMSESPLFEYITGVLAPSSTTVTERDAEAEAEMPFEESIPYEEGDFEQGVQPPPFTPPILDPANRPSSMGVSFSVEALEGAPAISICLTWARYLFDDSKKIWKRSPRCFVKRVPLTDRSIDHYIDSEGRECGKGDAEVMLRIIRREIGENMYYIAVYLVNVIRLEQDERYPRAEHHIFQPQIRVVCEPGTRIVPARGISAKSIIRDELERELDFLYRNRIAKARGFLCSAVWREIDSTAGFTGILDFPEVAGQPPFHWVDGELIPDNVRRRFMLPDVRSEFVPIYHVPASSLDWNGGCGQEPELRASVLAECWDPAELERSLRPLLHGYREWIETQKKLLGEMRSDDREIAVSLIENLESILRRMEKGLRLLCEDVDARLAFCFANRALDIQFEWTRKEKLIWRPFQLAFFLMLVESIVNPESEDRRTCDLLWVPTGAGKTEAYLALTAFTLAYRRRRALKRETGDRTGAGVSVITRYTLRLLTIQQFRRVLSVVLACEYLRVFGLDRQGPIGWRPNAAYRHVEENFLWGSSPFYAGLWVGGKVTPNRLMDLVKKEIQIYGALSILKGRDGEGEPAQVLNCPVCGGILAVPGKGLEPGERIFIVVKVSDALHDNFPEEFNRVFPNGELRLLRIIRMSNPCYVTLELEVGRGYSLKPDDVDNLWRRVSSNFNNIELVPPLPSKPGYFLRYYINRSGRKIEYDFDIYCPNPECGSRHPWMGGAPAGSITARRPEMLGDLNLFPDGNLPIDVQEPFRVQQDNSYLSDRIPIPALTVDDQIYHRIPAVLVSTVDKFARPAFEPRAAAIFGNVEYHHSIYGYYRSSLHVQKERKRHPSPKGSRDDLLYIGVDRLDPPDLILQDELHLIVGPLGSLVGIYETAVEFLCDESGRVKPKYVASTATAMNAEEQVSCLFLKGLTIFPPPGLSFDDRFFIREFEEHPLNDRIPGRLYVGICAFGKGPQTAVTRVWSRLLQVAYEKKGYKEIDYFWTLTGYFNSLRELGGARSLCREDIPLRLYDIAGMNSRRITEDTIQELSGNVSSTELPSILNSLERPYPSAPDVLLTTSMFGTGVDIPRISLMVVHGQPKTTSSYIQSTGRVGRRHGGLVIVLYRATRPRDLNHYEFFCGYHRQLHRYVEPSTIYPFAPYVVERVLGPLIVFMLRNMRLPTDRWALNSATKTLLSGKLPELNTIVECMEYRLRGQPDTRRALGQDIRNRIVSTLDRWRSVARRVKELLYTEVALSSIPRYSVVLGDPTHQHEQDRTGNIEVVYRNVPQSLREVEETIGFGV
jgi:hypothetical protein